MEFGSGTAAVRCVCKCPKSPGNEWSVVVGTAAVGAVVATGAEGAEGAAANQPEVVEGIADLDAAGVELSFLGSLACLWRH